MMGCVCGGAALNVLLSCRYGRCSSFDLRILGCRPRTWLTPLWVVILLLGFEGGGLVEAVRYVLRDGRCADLLRTNGKIIYIHPRKRSRCFSVHPEEVALFSVRPEEVALFSVHPEEVALFSVHPEEVALFSVRPEEVALFSVRPEEVALFSVRPEEVAQRPSRRTYSPKINFNT